MFLRRMTAAFLTVVVVALTLGIAAGAAQKPVEIVYLSAGTAEVEQAHDRKWVEEWNRTHPNIQVRYEVVAWADLFTKVMAYRAAGTPPDIAWYAPAQINEWYQMGLLEPLEEWLGEEKATFLDALTKPGSDIVYDGKMYGAPFCVVGRALVARKDKLEAAGINPNSIKTWDDYLRAVKATTAAPKQYGTMLSLAEPRLTAHHMEFYFPSNGLENIAQFDPKYRDKYIRTLRFIADLFPYMPPAQINWVHSDTVTAYANGTVALFPTGSYFQGDLMPVAPELMTPEKTIVLPMPYGPGRTKPVTSVYTVGYVMFKDSQHKKEAAEFLRFMVSDRVVNEWPMNLAPKKTLTVDDRVAVLGERVRWWQEQWLHLLNTTEVIGLPQYIPAEETNRVFCAELVKLFRKQVTPEQAYESLQKQIVPLLQGAKK